MRKIILVILLIATALFGLDYTYSFLIQENQNIKISHVMKGGKNYDVLFHGPCEPLFTIDASHIDSLIGTQSYNFALRHTDFADNYLHLYLYLKKNKAPKQVYLYVTPESFDRRFNAFHTYRFAPYLGDSVVDSVVHELDPKYYAKSRFPFMRFAFYNSYKTFDALQGLKHYLKGKKNAYFKDGYIAHPDNIYHTQPDGYIAPKHLIYAANMDVTVLNDSAIYYELYAARQRFNWDKSREKYLKKMFELCRTHNIELILYESPVYAPSVIDQPNREQFIDRTKEIAKTYGSEYLTFDIPSISQHKSNFVCPLILSVKGTTPFLSIFAQSIQKRLAITNNSMERSFHPLDQ